MKRSIPAPTAGITPVSNRSAKERGDTGRGPMPKTGLGEDRHVNLKEPGRGSNVPQPAGRTKNNRPKLTLPQKAT